MTRPFLHFRYFTLKITNEQHIAVIYLKRLLHFHPKINAQLCMWHLFPSPLLNLNTRMNGRAWLFTSAFKFVELEMRLNNEEVEQKERKERQSQGRKHICVCVWCLFFFLCCNEDDFMLNAALGLNPACSHYLFTSCGQLKSHPVILYHSIFCTAVFTLSLSHTHTHTHTLTKINTI